LADQHKQLHFIITYEDPEKAAVEPMEARTMTAENFILKYISCWQKIVPEVRSLPLGVAVLKLSFRLASTGTYQYVTALFEEI
jgi:hypothetical protein